jgi:thiol-disulfide isomerase/thioredoxin
MKAVLPWLLLAATVTPSGPHSTPQECLHSLESYTMALGKANHDLVSSSEDYRRAVQDKVVAQAAIYAAQFKAKDLHGETLKDLALLQGEAAQWPQARAVLDQYFNEPGLTAAARTKALSEAIESFANFQRSARGKERDSVVDGLIARLDAQGNGALHERINARGILIRRDSGRDDRAALESDFATYRRLFQQLPSAAVGQHDYFGLYESYTAVADYYAEHGDYSGGARILREGVAALKKDRQAASVANVMTYDLGRYEQIGKSAHALVAEHWLNASPAAGRMDINAKATLLQFTAHWCIPCRETYPLMVALDRKYAEKGLKVVFVTELYGWYAGKRPASAQQELAYDRNYFVGKHGITFPVAISNQPQTMQHSPNSQSYFSQAIPQLVLIDRKGIVREVRVGGLEKEGEATLTAQIERLLN